MKTETIEGFKEEIRRLEELRKEVHDYDFDGYILWHLDEAIRILKNPIR